ncbi:hypothetical protein LYSHEL_25900 [Lysobacter helvus]|uniref:Serine aminopeptidase S33 domain-containing protein n=1 Tax=Lysobacter helvus TaxID=2675059 RepID=A0ABN6G5Y5_9GAMM|nr:alpha/beta fold hydrolase [Lysobacter helvus]BCT96719.1 hypothetical protein LYSHEL_25900 [Lysobacter helvus]
MLPGLDGTGALHGDFLVALDGAFSSTRVIAYPTDRFLDHAALEAFVRDALPAEDPFVLLGESFSGPIALAIAASQPANLAGLVLSTTFARFPTRVLSALSPLLPIAPVHHAPRALLRWWLLGDDATPAQIHALSTTLQRVAPTVLRRRSHAALRVDASAHLDRIRVPTLYLRGRRDRLVSRAAGESLRTSLPDCTLVDIAGPHLLLQAAPQACARAVIDFARRLPASRRIA